MYSGQHLDEPVLAELYGYWQQLHQTGDLPRRSDIDPLDIPHLLPHLAITEIVKDRSVGRDFRIRYRLAGTKIEQHFGCSLTNRYLDDLIQGPFIDYIDGLYRELTRTKRPHYSESTFGDADQDEALRAKRLLLPLCDDRKQVAMVLAGVVFADGLSPRRQTVLHSHRYFTSSLYEKINVTTDQGALGA